MIPYDAAEAGGDFLPRSVFSGVQRKNIILPPFPIKEKYVAGDMKTESSFVNLQGLYNRYLLVRFRSFFRGGLNGEKLLLPRFGTGLIQEGHRQGGSSAHGSSGGEKTRRIIFWKGSAALQEQLEPYALDTGLFCFRRGEGYDSAVTEAVSVPRAIRKPAVTAAARVQDPRFSVLEKALRKLVQ